MESGKKDYKEYTDIKMIKIKLIPNILSKEGRKERKLKYFRSKKLLSYLEECNFPTKDIKVIISGKVVTDLNTFIKNKDEIIVTPEVEITAVAFAKLGFWAKVFFVAKTIFTVVAIGYTIYSMLSKPRGPSFSGIGTGIDEGSATYGWDGIRTIQEVGVPVAVIYGEHDFGGNIINAYVRTDGDKNYLNVLLGVGEGEMESFSNLRINGNPSANFDDISTTTKMGTNSQTVIPNFEDAHNVYSVNVVLTKDNPHVYTTIDSDVEAFEIYLQLSSGLYQQDTSSGAVQEWSVTYKVEYKLHADPGYTDLGSTTITAKSRTTVRRIYRKVDLTAGQYDIRVTRTSDDSSLDPIKQGDLTWTQADEIKTDDYTYPNTGLYAIEALATDQLSGSMPNFTFTVKGKKVSAPYVLNGSVQVDWEDYYWNQANTEFRLLSDDTSLTWDGATYADQYCANPLWCTKDLIIANRYGLGEFIDSTFIDDALFLEMAKYCEEKVPDGEGGFEKRFRMNVVLDSSTKALDLLTQLCSIFNGLPFYSEAAIKIQIDKEEDSVQLFTMGNIIKDSFQQSWKSQKEVPNILEVQFLDKDQDYKQETIAYQDYASLAAGDPERKQTIRIFATHISQVIRTARYNMKVAKNINRTFSFRVGIDALACQPADVISIQHDVPQWGWGGRVKTGSTTSSVVVDQTLTIEDGKNYSVQVQFADDSIEERVVTNVPGDVTTLTVSSVFSSAPTKFDKFTFGETNSIEKKARIFSMDRASNNEAEISCAEYITSVYDDSDIVKPVSNFSALTLVPPAVSALNLTEALVKLPDGTIEDAIDVWWDKPTQTNYVKTYERGRIYLSEDNINWRKVGEATGYHYRIVGDLVDKETYYVKVVTVTADGEEGTLNSAPSSEITMIGKSASPSDVATFIVKQSRDRLTAGWSKISDVDVRGYEIRHGADWDSGEFVVFVEGDKFITTNFRTGSSQSYWIKALDTSENYSENATEATLTVDIIPFRNIVNNYSEQTAWTGSKSNTEVDGDNLIISSGQLSGTYITAEQDIGYVATFQIATEIITAITQGTKYDSDAGAKYDDDATTRYTGSEAPGSWSLEIRTSEDDITWTSYETWEAGDYKCRYFQLRLTLTRESTETSLICSKFDYFADLPDVDDFGTGEVTDVSAGDDISFAKTYHETPVVAIEIDSGEASFWKATSIDTTGFTVHLYDAAGASRLGTFSWKSHGI